MRKNLALAFSAAALSIGAVVFAVPSIAHHSTAMFEWGKETEMKNVTVERWLWTNPHAFLYVRDSAGVRWAFEGMSPNHLDRAGWSKRSLSAGDKIDVTYYPLRDDRKGGFNVTVRKANGQVLKQLPVRE